MTGGLNSVVRSLTGPRRLRSALRQKSVAIKRVLNVLAGPTELCVRIPASVFGGDIFGVMSSQLREALIVPPPPPPAVSTRQRKSSPPSAPNAFAKHSTDFGPLADWLKQSTICNEPVAAVSKNTFRLNQNTTSENPGVSSLGPQASRLPRIATGFFRDQAGETPAVPGKSTTESVASSGTKQSFTAPALVSSLQRYWDSIGERRASNQSPASPVSSEPFASAADFQLSEPEQRTTRHAWPNFAGRDVSEKLRSFTDGTNPPQKSPRFSSQPDRQDQNAFNVEVNHANNPAPAFDDLGDRIAQILHEQALQHGIDVT